MITLPPLNDQFQTLDRHGLARLLAPIIYKSESSILRDISRNPKSLPRPDKKSGRTKIWFTQNVYHWIFPSLFQRIEDKLTNSAPGITSLAESLLSISADADK
jgi:hypothetical protein